MCTYEDLVDATLPHGLIPLVVPQLRTITLGGAVTGLGIESTSFRSGLPHESVLEMDVFTGAGEVVTATPGQRARRPVRDVPQLLRLPRLRHPAADRARAGRAPTSPCATCASATRRRSQDAIAEITATRRVGRRARRRAGRDRVRAGGVLPDPGDAGTDADRRRDDRATTPGSRSTGARSSSGRPTC